MVITVDTIMSNYAAVVSGQADIFLDEYREELLRRAKEGEDVYEYFNDSVHIYTDDLFNGIDYVESALIVAETFNPETDSGLWYQQDPKTAISTMAFYSFRNDLHERVLETLLPLLRMRVNVLENAIDELEMEIAERDARGQEETATQVYVDKAENAKEELDNIQTAINSLQ
jgi:hypothetical protein